MLTDPERARILICDKILNGKDPSRPWSYDAQHRLSELCNEKHPMPLAEILDVAAYRAIPKTPDIPELKNRVDIISETTLMNFWGDEVTRARGVLKKYGGRNEAKIEPPRWREFFQWKNGADVVLPAVYEKLDAHLRREYERDFQTFELAEAATA